MGPLWPASGRDLRGLMVGTVVISVDPGDGGLSELCWLDHMWGRRTYFGVGGMVCDLSCS
jgi:hypothetical protein